MVLSRSELLYDHMLDQGKPYTACLGTRTAEVFMSYIIVQGS